MLKHKNKRMPNHLSQSCQQIMLKRFGAHLIQLKMFKKINKQINKLMSTMLVQTILELQLKEIHLLNLSQHLKLQNRRKIKRRMKKQMHFLLVFQVNKRKKKIVAQIVKSKQLLKLNKFNNKLNLLK